MGGLKQLSVQNWLANERAATAVVVAILLPVLCGAAALGAEAGFWTYRQRLLQQFADVAAYSAAIDLLNGGNSASLHATAGASLSNNGLRKDIGRFTASSPPANGVFDGLPAVEVSVREDWPRFFTAIFLEGEVTLAAQATAQIASAGEACVLALDSALPGAATISGSANVALKNCSLISNSMARDALKVAGSGKLLAACAGTAGGVDTTRTGISLSECAAPRVNLPSVKDPYETLPVPETSADCEASNTFGGSASSSFTIKAGRYCGMTIQRSVMLEPGLYIIDGGTLRINSSARLRGTGVTFALKNGARLNINGAADIDLSGPTSGTYSGIIFLGERTGRPVRHTLNGSASSVLHGAIYFPNDHLEVRGSNTSGAGCTQIIARTVDFRGAAGAGVNCEHAGVKAIDLASKVKLVR